jgi:hemerythrin-like domain-containing protein
MMKVTERLKAEHGVLLMLLDHLEETLRNGAEPAVLQATTAAVAAAEEKHALFEERLLFRLVAASLGLESPLISSLLEEHERVAALSRRIQAGTFDEGTVAAYVAGLRHHIERETHRFFPLIDEVVPEEKLVAAGNWDAEHVAREAMGNRHRFEEWLERGVSRPAS